MKATVEKTIAFVKPYGVLLLWIVALLLFSLFFLRQMGYTTDFSTHYAWAVKLRDGELRKFYEPGYFADYLPLYMYVLKGLGILFGLLNIGTFDAKMVAWLKVPSLLLYAVFGLWILRQKKGWMAARTFLGLLSAAVMYNLFGFGQVDSILVVLGTVWAVFFMERRFYLAHLFLVLLLTFKPQGIFFLPLYGIGTAYQLWRKELSLGRYAALLAVSALLVLVIFAPFRGFSPQAVMDAYFNIKDAYPYATVNAFNLYWLLGANWKSVDQAVLLRLPPLVIFFLGAGGWLALVVRSAWKRGRHFWDTDFLLLLGATSTLLVYVLGPRMHERYSLIAFPFIFLLSVRHHKYLWAQIVFSIASALNQAMVVDNAFGTKMAIDGPIAYFCSAAFVVLLAFFCIELYRSRMPVAVEADQEFFPVAPFIASLKPQLRFDLRLLSTLAIVFIVAGLFTFLNLGAFVVPESKFLPPQGTKLTIDWQGPQRVASLWIYSRGGEGTILYGKGEQKFELGYTNYYAWKEVRLATVLASPTTFTVNIVNQKPLSEIIFVDQQSRLFAPDHVCSPDCVPAKEHPLFRQAEDHFHQQNFLFGTYFDEVYYARAIEELSLGKAPWENTHPALSKFMIYAWYEMTNFSPFNWRFINALFGVFCAVIIAWIGFVFCGFPVGLGAGLLAALEFSRIAISRISTIDALVGFGILLSYGLCFVVITQLIKRSLGKFFWVQLLLFASALGYAISIKWNAMFTLMTCGLLFGCAALYFLYEKFSWKTLVFLFTPVILIPPLFYWLSFQPFHFLLNEGYSLKRFFMDQKSMWDYHSQLKATHPFSAWYWTWPFLQKPMWFYTDADTLEPGFYRSIVVFGNPALWWSVVPMWIYLLQQKIIPRHGPLALIFIAWCAQYFSWMPASRIIFLYHYFPSMMLSLIPVAFCLHKFWYEKRRRAIVGMGIIYAALFVLFFPIITGMRVSHEYVDHVLKWFNTWFF